MERKTKKFLTILASFALFIAFASCNHEGNDGVYITEGTKLSDFTGHANTLSWAIGGKFLDQNGDGLKFTDTTIEGISTEEGAETVTGTYTITKIIGYKEEQTVSDYDGPCAETNNSNSTTHSVTAPKGSWRIYVKDNNSDAYGEGEGVYGKSEISKNTAENNDEDSNENEFSYIIIKKDNSSFYFPGLENYTRTKR